MTQSLVLVKFYKPKPHFTYINVTFTSLEQYKVENLSHIIFLNCINSPNVGT